MTGLGRDGSNGAKTISNNGGIVLIQDPDTAVAPSMPNAAIMLGFNSKIVKQDMMAQTIKRYIREINLKLK